MIYFAIQRKPRELLSGDYSGEQYLNTEQYGEQIQNTIHVGIKIHMSTQIGPDKSQCGNHTTKSLLCNIGQNLCWVLATYGEEQLKALVLQTG